jgi:hypothetical protein
MISLEANADDVKSLSSSSIPAAGTTHAYAGSVELGSLQRSFLFMSTPQGIPSNSSYNSCSRSKRLTTLAEILQHYDAAPSSALMFVKAAAAATQLVFGPETITLESNLSSLVFFYNNIHLRVCKLLLMI